MLLGIISDTHDELARTERAVGMLRESEAGALIHCGDLAGPEIVRVCAELTLYFVFGNWDADNVPALRRAAKEHDARCLDWGDTLVLDGRTVGVVHGHMRSDVRRVMASKPDYLFSGHSHIRMDSHEGETRRINPGALHDAAEFTVALLDLQTGNFSTWCYPLDPAKPAPAHGVQ